MALEIKILNGTSLQSRELRGILRTLCEVFRVPANLERSSLNPSRAFDASRHQTNSTALLAQMLDARKHVSIKQIAIVEVDLFIPILTFVFGEAQLSGIAAIVSTHRLSNQFYGLARNDALMLKRLEKEIVHELGHTFGLLHCRQFECVMRSSTYVEEIDIKHHRPCASCMARLSETGEAPPVSGPPQ